MYAFFARADTVNEPPKPQVSYPYITEAYVYAVNTITDFYKPVGNGQCVDFIKAHGYEKYNGNAKQWIDYINADKPEVGGVVVLSESRLGHLALIKGVTKEGVEVVEQNYEGLYKVTERIIPFSYEKIIGYILR